MDWINSHIASITILIPLITSIICLAFPRFFIARRIALIGSGACFFSSLHIWYHYKASLLGVQFTETYALLNQFGINYQVGVDGLNLLFIVLCTFLTPFIIYNLPEKQIANEKILLALIMLLETATLGALMALDLFLFYFFWEATIIPLYLIIGFWGGKKRIKASTKLFIFNASGSTLMLLAIIALYLKHAGDFGFYSASLTDLLKLESLDFSSQNYLFFAFAISFATKAPIWPLHTWLVSAYSQAPMVGLVILSGVFLKVSLYGFLRLAIPLFPDSVSSFASMISSLGIIGMILAAFAAYKQEDLKKLMGYASISHFSLAVLGCVAFEAGNLASEALLGAICRNFCHTISFTALFFIIASIFDCCNPLKRSSFTSLPKISKTKGIILLFIALDCLGLPGTGGYVGQFLILSTSFKQNAIAGWLALFGILVSTGYIMRIHFTILSGFLSKKNTKLLRFSAKEKCLIAPLISLSIVMGVYPELFLSKIRPTIEHLAKNYRHYQLEPEEVLSYRIFNKIEDNHHK